MFTAEWTIHQGTDRETTYEDTFDTREEAVAWIERWSAGHMVSRAWINNKEVTVRGGKVIEVPQKYETGSNDYQQGFVDCVEFLAERLPVAAIEQMMKAVTKEVFISTKHAAEEAAVTRHVAEQNRANNPGAA